MSRPRSSPRKVVRKYAIPVAVLIVGLPVGIGVMMAMGSAPKDKNPVFTRVTGNNSRFAPEAQPRWEPVKTLMGSAGMTSTFTVAPDASQWRVTWSCDAGQLGISDTVGGSESDLVDSACPRDGVKTGTSTGAHMLAVTAGGAWHVKVEQQVHNALEEPPLAGMTPDRLVASGRLYPIQRKARGTVSVYKLSSGRLALRFEDFYTTGSPGLEVWLSSARKPKSTLESRDASHYNAGSLRSTLGSYNQMLPRRASLDRLNSIIIWCPTVTIAFGAAALGGT
jgi:hypothetical protein